MTDNQLPLFEGRTPDTAHVKISGSVEFARELATAHRLQQTVFLVVETTVGSVTHQVDADGDLHRIHALKAESLAVLPASEGAALLIATHKRAREAAGIHELPLEENVDLDTGEIEHPDDTMEVLERAFEGQSSRS